MNTIYIELIEDQRNKKLQSGVTKNENTSRLLAFKEKEIGC